MYEMFTMYKFNNKENHKKATYTCNNRDAVKRAEEFKYSENESF